MVVVPSPRARDHRLDAWRTIRRGPPGLKRISIIGVTSSSTADVKRDKLSSPNDRRRHRRDPAGCLYRVPERRRHSRNRPERKISFLKLTFYGNSIASKHRFARCTLPESRNHEYFSKFQQIPDSHYRTVDILTVIFPVHYTRSPDVDRAKTEKYVKKKKIKNAL